MKLIQIPFSHNCVKVRVGLALKNLTHHVENIAPMNRSPVVEASRQGLVPVLVDGDRAIADSTAILLYLDGTYPDPPLVPRDANRRAECLVLEDWSDRAFMEVSRRIAYRTIIARPGALARMFFPEDRGLVARWKERVARKRVRERFRISDGRHAKDLVEARQAAALAMSRLGGRPWLMDHGPTIADIALATMSAPLAADPALRADEAVAGLLAWGERLVPPDMTGFYRS